MSETRRDTCAHCDGHGFVTIVLDKTCAHCGDPFATQSGRVKSRHRTVGVIYCSRRCANAASQAKYRSRQKERIGL